MNLLERYKLLSVQTRSAIWFAASSCVLQGINFISLPFFTRLMSVEQYGIVAAYGAWVTVITVFATLNIQAGAFNSGITINSEKKDEYSSSMQGLLLVLCVVVFIATFGFAAVIYNFFDLPLIFIALMFVQILATGFFSLFSARERYDYRYRTLLFFTLLYAVLSVGIPLLGVYFCPNENQKAVIKVVGTIVGMTIVGLIILVYTQKKKPCFFNKEFWKFAICFTVPLVPHYLSMIVLGQSDRIIISSLCGESAVAVYTVAYQIGTALTVISGALNSSIVPWQYQKIKASDYRGLKKKLNQYVVLVVIIAVILSLFSPELMLIAAPASYQDAVYVIPPVIAGIVFTFVYNVLSNYEFYYMANKAISVASVIAAVLNIVLNFALIPQYGFMVAAYTTLFCYAALALFHTLFALYVVRKKVGKVTAKEFFSPASIWAVCLVGTVFILATIVIFDYLVIRLILISIGIITCFVARKKALWKSEC